MKDLTKEMHFAENGLTTAKEIEKLAIELLNTTWTIDLYRYQDAKVINLLDLGWCFEFNSRKRAAGLCSKREKTIYISKWLLDQNLDKSLEFENTLRHELAHALDFEIRGKSNHDKVWKFIARQVLCTAERCYSNKVIQTKVETKYTLKCVEEGCDYTRPSHKARPKNARSYPCCTDCYNAGKGYKRLVQIQNY
jgi:predicted SprT family Zn-dependent metalloprotease